MKEEQIFRSSFLPTLSVCLHAERDPQAPVTESMQYGLKFHSDIALALLGELPGGVISDPDVAWAVQEIDRRGITVEAVEETLPLFNSSGELVLIGTIDWRGVDKEGRIWVGDWKTGDRRDYSMQYQAYVAAVHQMTGISGQIMFLEVYPSLRESYEYEYSVTDSEHNVVSLYDSWKQRTPDSGYHINSFCDRCIKKQNCPEWIGQANLALARADYPPLLRDGPGSVEHIKADPSALGEFYAAFKRLEKLVGDWKIKEKVHEYLQNSIEVPGFTLVRDPKRETADVEEVIRRVVLESMGTSRACEFLSVSVEKLREAWASWEKDKPLPVSIRVITPETFHVRTKSLSGGTGKAIREREKRKNDRN
jgi:hypothetical protein